MLQMFKLWLKKLTKRSGTKFGKSDTRELSESYQSRPIKFPREKIYPIYYYPYEHDLPLSWIRTDKPLTVLCIFHGERQWWTMRRKIIFMKRRLRVDDSAALQKCG